MKFAAIALFIPLWVTLIYFPIAHMVWYWPGPARSRMPPKRSPRLLTVPQDRGAGQARRDQTPTPAGSSRRVRIDLRRRHVVQHQRGIAGLVGAS